MDIVISSLPVDITNDSLNSRINNVGDHSGDENGSPIDSPPNDLEVRICNSCGQNKVRPYPEAMEERGQPAGPEATSADESTSVADIVARIAKVCSKTLPGVWRNRDMIEVTQISGGLSNYLYLCAIPEELQTEKNEPRKVLCRVYGHILSNNTESIIADAVLFAILSEKKFGPKLYGVFTGGRIEEYIESRNVLCSELPLPAVYTKVAALYQNLHQLDMPFSKTPRFIFNLMNKWSRDLKEISNPKVQEVISQYDVYEKIENTRNLFQNKLHGLFPVVFCHNDLQENNILYLNSPESEHGFKIQMIDYEYASYNYRAFDFGHFFTEWMFDYVVSEYPWYSYRRQDFPSIENQLEFWRAYKLANDTSSEELFLAEVQYGVLLCNLFWGVWSLMQYEMFTCRFGFLEHAVSRFEVFNEFEKTLPSLDNLVAPEPL